MSRITAATSGANNMAGLVEQVENPGSSEISPAVTTGAGSAMGPYPHDQNGTPGGSFPGPVSQPEQNLGNP